MMAGRALNAGKAEVVSMLVSSKTLSIRRISRKPPPADVTSFQMKGAMGWREVPAMVSRVTPESTTRWWYTGAREASMYFARVLRPVEIRAVCFSEVLGAVEGLS
jgi:hypothetical protein